MGVKLKSIMKIILLYFGWAILFGSCSISNNIESQDPAEANWVHAFKTTVFISCMNSSDKNSQDISKAICFDIIGNIDYFERADSIGKHLSEQILPSPIIDFDGGKPVTIQCLDYYSSSALDSIAKSEFKKFKKERKLDFQ